MVAKKTPSKQSEPIRNEQAQELVEINKSLQAEILERKRAEEVSRGQSAALAKTVALLAAELFITEGTVKVHVNNILHKLGTRGRTEAVAFAIRHGMVRLG